MACGGAADAVALIACPADEAPAEAAPPVTEPAAPLTMVPIAFDGQAGWWHAAAGDTAVVLCPPVGRDARCAYRPLSLFAEQLAEAGYPTLRFDYPGEGESLDVDPLNDALPLWRTGVRSAVRQARRLGAQRVVLAGLRLGAALALELAGEVHVDGLMLLAPVVSGRGWLRELKLRASMATLAFRDPDPGAFVSDDLSLSPATVEGLGAWDLKAAAAPSAPTFLSAQSPAVAALAERLRAGGAVVEAQGFPGYDDLFEEPHSNLSPQATFEAALAWLRRTLPSRPRSLGFAPPRSMSGPGWVEEGVRFGAGLCGVLCRPAVGRGRPEAVVFLSTGGDPRAGLGRFAVTAGRDLAAQGVTSLRFDFAGVGDSAAPGGADRSHVFETPRGEDIGSALDLLQAGGHPSAALVGICAGAYHAVRGAADPRVGGLLAISTLKFVWRPGSSFSIGGKDREAGATIAYVEGLKDARNWLRVLKGDVQVGRILRALASRLGRRLAPGNDGREGARVIAGLQAFTGRGGRARFILGIHDAALDEMERWFGRGGRRLAAMPKTSVRVIPTLDHGLSYGASRALAMEELRLFVGLSARG